MKTVLCLDGGGVRGIIPAMILEEIERRSGKPISECFDLITGVSTGGIIGIALTVPDRHGKSKYKASDVVKFYQESSKQIFSPRLKYPFYYLLKSKYRHKPLRETVKKQLGNLEFKQLNNKVMVPCYDINERRPYFFKNWKPSVVGIGAYEVAVATCCAPTYFDPYILSNANGSDEKALIDGSVCTNNPSMCAYAEAKRMWPDEDIYVISLGTGDISEPIKYKETKHWGVLPWFKNDVIEILVDAPTNTVDYQLRTICPDNYIRIHNKITFADEKLDNTSSSNIKKLIIESKGLIASEDYRIERIIEIIERRNRQLQTQK